MAELESTQVLPSIDRGPFRAVTLSARLSVDTVGFRVLLYELETTAPRLRIEKLTVIGGGYVMRDRLEVRAQVRALIEAEEPTG